MTLTIYGDSILKGVLFENGSYVLEKGWEKALERRFCLSIENRSRFGSTIEKALPRLRRESGAAEGAGEPVLLEFGGNDCDYDWAAIDADPQGLHRCKTPPERFAAAYREAIGLLRESGRRPVALTLPPIHSERYLSFLCRRGLSREHILSWLGDVEAISRWQQTYSELVRQLAREEQAALIDLRAAFPAQGAALEDCLCDDGIHPSRAGQTLIVEALSRSAALLAS